MHTENKAHAAVHQQCQTVCSLHCPTKLGWRKTALHLATERLPTHMALFYIKSSQDEYFMDANNTAGRILRCILPPPAPSISLGLSLEKEGDYFALDVNIHPYYL